MNEEWLVDGYNFLHAVARAKNFTLSSAVSKDEACSLLAGFASSKKQKMQVVLDGIGNPKELDIYTTAYFQAVYSQKVSADHYIEKYIYQNKLTAAFIVITDDRTISEIARGGGARVLKNSIFLEMLKEMGQESKLTINKETARSHGFNRPFDEKLKAKGL